jgi:hypothetical protein
MSYPHSKSRTIAVENLEDRKLFATGYDLGININDASSATMHKAIPVLKSLGVKSVRIWAGVSDFNKHNLDGALQRAVDYGHAGFDVMVIVGNNGGKVPNAAAVKGWFDWASSNPALKAAVDRWQVGNEVDHSEYWKGSLSSYVSGFLKPAAEALHANGETVVSGSVSWDPQDIKTMINAGMLNYTDYIGFHPYANGVSLQKQRINELKSIVGGRKPLAATEWNIRGYEKNKSGWAAAVQDAIPNVRNGFALNYYFGLINTSATMAGPGGIMNRDGSKTPFYYALQQGLGGSSSITPDANNGSTGSVPSSLPSVAKVSIYTSATRELVIDSVKSGATLNATAAGTTSFYIAAAAGSGVGSMKFVVDGKKLVRNASPFAWIRTLAVGKHTISVTPYSRDNGLGTKGATRSFTFTVTKPAAVAPKVTTLSLFNSDTDKAIAGFGDLRNGAVIDLAKIGAKHVNIVANTAGTTSSVRFKFNSVFSTDNTAAFSLFGGSSATNLNGKALAPGKYTVTATPFSQDNASGKAGAARVVSFAIKAGTVSKPTVAKPRVTSYRLIDTRTGKTIAGYSSLTSSRSIRLSSLPTRNLALIANVSGPVGSVKFTGTLGSRIDNTPSYATAAWYAKSGSFTFKSTAYSADNARGTAGNTLAVTLKFY